MIKAVICLLIFFVSFALDPFRALFERRFYYNRNCRNLQVFSNGSFFLVSAGLCPAPHQGNDSPGPSPADIARRGKESNFPQLLGKNDPTCRRCASGPASCGRQARSLQSFVSPSNRRMLSGFPVQNNSPNGVQRPTAFGRGFGGGEPPTCSYRSKCFCGRSRFTASTNLAPGEAAARMRR